MLLIYPVTRCCLAPTHSPQVLCSAGAGHSPNAWVCSCRPLSMAGSECWETSCPPAAPHQWLTEFTYDPIISLWLGSGNPEGAFYTISQSGPVGLSSVPIVVTGLITHPLLGDFSCLSPFPTFLHTPNKLLDLKSLCQSLLLGELKLRQVLLLYNTTLFCYYHVINALAKCFCISLLIESSQEPHELNGIIFILQLRNWRYIREVKKFA